MPFELPGTPKPGIDQFLIQSALQPELGRRLADSPYEVFGEFDLTEEQRDVLRKPDDRLLALLGAVLARQSEARPGVETSAEEWPTQPAPQGHKLPDPRLALTVIPVALEEGEQLRGLTFAAWVNPLPEGIDPATLPPPEDTVLPGKPLTPLRAVVHVSAHQLPDAGGLPQVGLTASLLQSSNMAAPPAPGTAGETGGMEHHAAPDIRWSFIVAGLIRWAVQAGPTGG